jgi:hypothetical protein
MNCGRPLSYGDLFGSELRLVRAMHGLWFGRFEQIRILNGEMVLSPWPLTVRAIKFGNGSAEDVPRLSAEAKLPRQLSELLAYIRSVATGGILTLEFRHGLPFAMEVEFRAETASWSRDD